jgi:predicted ATP-binding protein involved in virulence
MMVVMKVTKLNLTNFRDARDFSIELNPKPDVNVFVGVNGSGKSTVLDAIAIMLSWAVNRINRPGASGRPIVDRVLEDLMGLETTRPDEVDLDLKSIFETIDAGK